MTNNLMQFFAFAHLPDKLQAVSSPFYDLAEEIDETLPNNAEKTTALRKLLEAKDCAVRAVLFKDPSEKEQPQEFKDAAGISAS